MVVCCSLFLILGITLFPYDFSFKETAIGLEHYFLILKLGKLDKINFLQNILLFMPLGFGITYFMQKKKQGIVGCVWTLLISFGLSYAVEFLQKFLPVRNSSLIDVLSNSIGGLLGFLYFSLWGCRVLHYVAAFVKKSNEFLSLLSIKNLLLCFLGYITLTFLISISLQRDTRLSNWDMTYPFILGNELTGDRPWKGRIYELYIVNRAISEEEVEQAFSEKGSFNSIGDSILVSYQFKDNENHLDKMGSLPNLIWMGDSQVVQYDEGILLGPNHWLKTETSAEDLTRRIIETSQFTLSVKVATSDTMQTGPARIVSLSKDPYNRNFTLAQEESDLVFRLRTPLTGVDGSNPELIVPYIFSNTDPHNLLITYDGSVLNL